MTIDSPKRPERAFSEMVSRARRQTTSTHQLVMLRADSNGALQLAGSLSGVDNPYVSASGRRSFLSWHASGMSADDDLNSNLSTIRNRAQDQYRNTATARAAINRIVEGAVGTGLRMRSNIDWKFIGMSLSQAREWKAAAEREFQLWAETVECDYERQMTFGDIQRMVCKSQQTRGDCFALLPWLPRPRHIYDMRIQLIEADRVSNPQRQSDGMIGGKYVAAGIERDNNMIPTAVHICDRYPESFLFIASSPDPKWKRVPIYGANTGRRNVLRIMTSERIGQSRGEPILSPVMSALKQFSVYSDAELSAAVVNAMLSVFVKRPIADKGGYMGDDDDRPWEDQDTKQLGSGTWIDGAPGEELQVIAANRPSAQFEPFFLACMKQIGMALGVPFEVLVNHFSSSYSASRAAILEAYKHFKIIRKCLQQSFCQPIYEEWLLEAVIKGRIQAPGFLTDPAIRNAYCQAHWIGPTSGQIDPVREVEAANLRVKYGFSSRGIETAEITGMDFEDVCQARAEENALMESLNLPIPDREGMGATQPAPEAKNDDGVGAKEGADSAGENGKSTATKDVQQLALNGAQSQALQSIVEGVAGGGIPEGDG